MFEFGSIAKGRIPNIVIAAGSPARVVRRDIAWERPHLSLDSPPFKPNADSLESLSQYWALTEDSTEASPVQRIKRRLRRIATRLRPRRR